MFDSFSRRSFITSSGTAIAGLSLVTGWTFRAIAATKGAAPKWPEVPPPPDRNAGKREKLPPMHAPSEQNRGGDSAPLPADQRVGFALVGLGRLSIEELLPAFAESKMCKVTALVSGDREKAKRLAKQYGVAETSVYTYADFDKIKDNKDVDVVYIVLPNSMHHEFTLKTAKSGKHVLCEKPMAMNAKEAGEMVEACKKANVKLMIAYRNQYEPNNRWMRELVRQKTFGKVKLFEANNSQFADGLKGGKQQWRHIRSLAGGGALPDIGLYCLNGVRFLTGEEPYEVQAMEYSTPKDPRFTEVEETMSWMMRFPSGLMALCTTSYGGHETKRYQFTAEQGTFGMDPGYSYHGLKNKISYAMGGEFEHHETPSIPEKNQFALEMDHLADCILNKKMPATPGEEGWQDHRIMDAIYESARTRKVVTLERIEKLDVFRHDTIGK